MKNQMYKDAGCRFMDITCSFQACIIFDGCKARLIVEELKRPFGDGLGYRPAIKKKSSRPSNADLAFKYGVSKRQVSKAVKEALQTGKSIQTVLRRMSNESTAS